MDLQVLIVGGGIHGVGVLHDLASRGLTGIHLVEKSRLAGATSSRSTKLLHGGLRYLEHFGQWPLVREALQERTLLAELLKGVVRPLPFVLPCPRGGRPPWMIRTGLWLYDSFSGRSNLPRARSLGKGEIAKLAPYLPPSAVETDFRSAFLYYDAQMHDDVVVRVVAAAARRLGATHEEETIAESVTPIAGGFRVELASPSGRRTVTTRKIVNAGGSWTSANLLKWGFAPNVVSLLNIGSHLVFKPGAVKASPEHAAATLFQNGDGRIVFFIPWFGRWLLGTTESILPGDPAGLQIPASDKEYLLNVARRGLVLDDPEGNLEEAFSGIRMMPVGTTTAPASIPDAWRQNPFESPFYLRKYEKNISGLSRETILCEVVPGIVSVYGGKFTTYRSQCEKIGNRLASQLDCSRSSATRDPKCWFLDEIRASEPALFTSRPELRQMGG